MKIIELKNRIEAIIDKTDAAVLLKFLLDTDTSGLLTRLNEQAREETVILALKYADLIKNGKPIQYIIGEWEFYSLSVAVNKNVLIPRADTEVLVDEALKIIKKGDKIAELCTGSGCITMALLKNADCFVSAFELSEKAIKVAKRNIKSVNNENYEIVLKDVLEPPEEKLYKKYDMIVSNPPYIKSAQIKTLDKNVQNEPIMALDGGEDGLTFYRAISDSWKNILKEGGKILFEIGFDEAEEVSEILRNNGFEDITVVQDNGKNDRVIIGTLKT